MRMQRHITWTWSIGKIRPINMLLNQRIQFCKFYANVTKFEQEAQL